MNAWRAGAALAVVLGGCTLKAQEMPADAPPCVTYCAFAFQNCVNAPILYESWDACTTQCGAFPDTGRVGDTAGNTLQCRMTYVVIADQSPQAFCDNAAPDGGTACF